MRRWYARMVQFRKRWATRVYLTAAWALCCAVTFDALAQSSVRTFAETPSYTLQGRVVAVYDGDSFTLLAAGRRQRIRLASIDAPEMAQAERQRKGQAYARAARTALNKMIANKTVHLGCFETDAFGRHVCDVPLDAPLDGARTANQRMVALGMAWANRQQARFLRDPALIDLEQHARTEKRGLWRARKPVAPWVWRDQCWRRQQCR